MGGVHCFGPFRYDPAQRVLFREGELVPLAPKALDTLHALLERRGQVVDKGELMKLVWPDCAVEEIGLARNISLLRKALGDEGEACIETIPKRGYRFAAQSGAASAAAPPRVRCGGRAALLAGVTVLAGVVYWQFYRPSRYVPPSGGSANLAVVPFERLGADPAAGEFSQAFTETLVEEISKLKSVQVISPSTVQRYRSLRIPTAIMARLLGLHVVVEGTVQKSNGGLRVSVRLTDVHSGRLIRADGYDVATGDAQAQAAAARTAAANIGRHLAR
ncbi:MAG: winged helix-turn-helix domain-containing protein [Bryobacteraceae bacterium]